MADSKTENEKPQRCAIDGCEAVPLPVFRSIHDPDYEIHFQGYLCEQHSKTVRDDGPWALVWRDENSDGATGR